MAESYKDYHESTFRFTSNDNLGSSVPVTVRGDTQDICAKLEMPLE